MKAHNLYIHSALTLSMTLALSGCSTPQYIGNADNSIQSTYEESIKANQAITNQQTILSDDMMTALMPTVKLHLQKNAHNNSEKFDIAVKDMPAQAFFMGLVKGTSESMIVSPAVTGTITLNLKNVTTDQVLNAVRDVYGYEYQKTAYGYQIMPADLQTRIFTVNYLNVKRDGKSSTSISSGQITNTVNGSTGSSGSSGSSPNASATSSQSDADIASTVITTSATDFWTKLQDTLNTLIGSADGRSVVINSQTGIVIVRAFPKELQQVAKFLDDAQLSLTRQVILEAKIIEVELNENSQAGIDWGIFGLTVNSSSIANVPAFSPVFTVNAHGGAKFDSMLQLLSTQGTLHVLSSPRISTLNNQQALIKVGQDEFFVTNVENNVSTGTASTTNTSNVDVAPFFSGIALDVTPQIDRNGNITLHIHPLVSEVSQDDKTVTSGTTEIDLPLAKSKIRESDSIVTAQNGQVIVLGGLMQNDVRTNEAKTPGLGNLPWVGHLFKQIQHQTIKNELVILLRATVVGDDTWTKKLQESQQNASNVYSEIETSKEIPEPLKKTLGLN